MIKIVLKKGKKIFGKNENILKYFKIFENIKKFLKIFKYCNDIFLKQFQQAQLQLHNEGVVRFEETNSFFLENVFINNNNVI